MRRAKRALTLAALAAVGLGGQLASAASITWTGSTADPNSAFYTATAQGTSFGYTSAMPLYIWNTSVANWSNGGVATNYTVGDDVVFTDSTSVGGTVIRLPSSSMNPSSMTFSHASGPTAFTTYSFVFGGGTLPFTDFTDGSNGTGGTPPAMASSTPFGSGHSTVLTLDTGFNGKVVLRPRSSASVITGSVSNSIVRSGTLEISDGGALPNQNGNNNAPLLNLAGGAFSVNVNVANNTQPASTQLTGLMSVTANSYLINGHDLTATNSRLWGNNGTISIDSGVTLTVKSLFGNRADVGSNWTGSGTLLLQDAGGGTTTTFRASSNFKNAGGILDLGGGNSEFQLGTGSTTFDIGALYGGASTIMSGAASTATFSIGGRGDSTTYFGSIQDNIAAVPANVAKVGAGNTLTLAGANTATGTLLASAGTVLLTNTNMFFTSIAGGGGTIVFGGTGGSNAAGGGSLTVGRGGYITLDNSASSNNDRLADGGTVSLQGGVFEFIGNLAAPTAENTGVLAVTGASSVVKTTAAGVGSPASITFASLSRSNGQGVVDFQPAANVAISFTSPPALANGIIGGYATANSTAWATLSGGSVAAYTHTGGETNSAPAGWAGTDNILLSAGGTSNVAASATINSLHLDSNADVAIAAGQSLTVTTGGILSTGTAGGSITGAGSLTAGTGAGSADLIAIVADPANTLTITAPISDNTAAGTVSLIKAGPGKLVLGTSGTYTGGVFVYGGTLATSAANVLPSAGPLIVDFNQTFDLGGFNQGVATVSLINGSIINSGGAATLTGTAYDVRSGTISAVLGGAGKMTKSTGSTVTLLAANTYTGGTQVGVGSSTGGTLVAGVVNALPVGGSLTINNATVNIDGFNQNVGTLIVGDPATSGANQAAGNLQGTSGVITSSVPYVLNNGTINAILSGSVGLSKLTTNAGTILSANTYTGVSTLTAGNLNVTSLADGGLASSIGQSSSAAANLVFSGGALTYLGAGDTTDRNFTFTTTGTISASGSGPLVFSSTSPFVGSVIVALGGTFTGNNTFNPSISGSAGLRKIGSGYWRLGQVNTYTGDTQIDSGTLDIQGFNQNVGNFILNGGRTVGSGIYTSTNLDIRSGTADTVLAGATGTVGATKSTGGTATLTANNTYSGVVSINAGTLSVPVLPNGGVASPLGTSSNAASNLVLGGGTLMFTGPTTTTDRNFQLNGTSGINASGSGPLSFSSTATIVNPGGAAGLILGGTNTDANTLPMLLSGTGGIRKADGGQWVVTAANTYTGSTTFSGGTLTVSSIANGGVASNIGASTNANANMVFNNGTIRYTGSGATTDRLFQLGVSTLSGNGTIDSSGSGALQFTNTAAVTHSGTLNRTLGLTGSNTGDNMISLALVDGSGSLLSVTKAGSGKWILNGANTYAGTTNVTNGTLQVSHSASSAPLLTNAGGANITGGRVVFDYSASSTPAATVSAALTAAYANGFITGQIRSSNADSSIGLGWLDNAGSSTLDVARTYYGDADLNLLVDTVDFNILASTFSQAGTWQDADFDYSGTVDTVDFNLLASNFGRPALADAGFGNLMSGSGTPGDTTFGALVPEPTSVGLLGCLAGGLIARRRRRD